jgi:hypothetical protein
MRCSFVVTATPYMSTDDVSSHHAPMCSLLSSSSITRLHRYYEAIRLPVSHLPSSLFSCPAYSRYSERNTQGLPGCRVITMSNMPWSSTPGSRHHLAFNDDVCVDFHLFNNVVLPTWQLRGSIPSTFRLTACLLAILRLKLYVTIKPPRTRYPVVGRPSGTGFTPARIHDLARPHSICAFPPLTIS